jgi:hypothetical protein
MICSPLQGPRFIEWVFADSPHETNTTVLYTTARSRPTHWPFSFACCLLADRGSTCRLMSRKTCMVGGLHDGRRSFGGSASPAVFRPEPCSHHRPTGLVLALYGLDRLQMRRIHDSCHGANHAAGKAAASRFLLLRPWAKIWTRLRRLFSLAGTIINRRKAPCSIRSWRR